jgi:2-haloacid dehalogenase
MEKKMNSTTIVFDFGGVIMDWSPYYLYRQFFNDDPVAVDRFLQEIGFAGWNQEFDRGHPFMEGVAELSRRFPAYQELIQAFDYKWEETLAGAIEPTVNILWELKTAGYPLYGLSNWSAEKFAIVRSKYEFFNWFVSIILSGEVKLLKPDRQIFELLLNKIGRPANECLFIDDSIHNITAAKELGFSTILFKSPEQLKNELCQRGLI